MTQGQVGSPQKAVIIEDSATGRRMMRRLLEAQGYTVELFDSGAPFIDKLEQGALSPEISVALVDWMLPGDISGIDIVEALRRHETTQALPVLMVTTNIGIEYVSKALQAGCNEYLMKPFTREALEEKLALLGLGEHGAKGLL